MSCARGLQLECPFCCFFDGHYAIFIALRGCDECQDVSDNQKMPRSS